MGNKKTCPIREVIQKWAFMTKFLPALLLFIGITLYFFSLFQTGQQTQTELNKKAYIQSELKDKKYINDFIEAAESGDHELVEKYLELGMDPNAMSDKKTTALMAASLNGHNIVIKKLLKYNANPNIINSQGWQAKEYALIQGHQEIYNLLASFAPPEAIANRKLSNTDTP